MASGAAGFFRANRLCIHRAGNRQARQITLRRHGNPPWNFGRSRAPPETGCHCHPRSNSAWVTAQRYGDRSTTTMLWRSRCHSGRTLRR
ncbi:hypothetical protein BIWAKO_04671 [Bosea sp. BIWAKO-01]|nr:hypothetical protein BIWAKO_04671 [Bosea sp. BIWAKO-01]